MEWTTSLVLQYSSKPQGSLSLAVVLASCDSFEELALAEEEAVSREESPHSSICPVRLVKSICGKMFLRDSASAFTNGRIADDRWLYP